MTRVLIVTKNLLAEQSLQDVLQRSDIEVYCSNDLMNDTIFLSQIVKYFSMVIFSDTVSNFEISKYYSFFQKEGLLILRKGNKEDLKNSDFSYLLNEISAWIDPKMPDIMVIEKIAKLMNNQERLASSLNERNHNLFSKNENNSKGFFFSLSPNEKKILYYLYQYQKDGRIVSRNELCNLIWGSDVTNSRLCQLSNLSNRIKMKLEMNHFPEGELINLRNKGYLLGDLLLIEVGENLS